VRCTLEGGEKVVWGGGRGGGRGGGGGGGGVMAKTAD